MKRSINDINGCDWKKAVEEEPQSHNDIKAAKNWCVIKQNST